jgi:hypothetical protein
MVRGMPYANASSQMTQTQPNKHETPRTTADHTDSFDRIRAAAQELHGAISDAAAKHGQAVKDHLEAIPRRAAALVESVKAVVDVRTEITKKHLDELAQDLEATEQHVAESLKSNGQAFHTALRQALADSRSAVTKISEIVAARRSAVAKQRNKE